MLRGQVGIAERHRHRLVRNRDKTETDGALPDWSWHVSGRLLAYEQRTGWIVVGAAAAGCKRDATLPTASRKCGVPSKRKTRRNDKLHRSARPRHPDSAEPVLPTYAVSSTSARYSFVRRLRTPIAKTERQDISKTMELGSGTVDASDANVYVQPGGKIKNGASWKPPVAPFPTWAAPSTSNKRSHGHARSVTAGVIINPSNAPLT